MVNLLQTEQHVRRGKPVEKKNSKRGNQVTAKPEKLREEKNNKREYRRSLFLLINDIFDLFVKKKNIL